VTTEIARAELEKLAASVRPLCSSVSVRDANGVPFLLAVDHPIMFSLEVRLVGQRFVVEYWRGPMNEDVFVSEASYATATETLSSITTWLRGVVT
jgi:hypothetical protein